MPSVYCSGPVKPRGTISGQRSGPSRRSKSTLNEPPVKSTRVIFAVSGQSARSGGELTIVAFAQSNGTYLNVKVCEYGPSTSFVGSSAFARQKYVALVVSRAFIATDVWPPPSPTVDANTRLPKLLES